MRIDGVILTGLRLSLTSQSLIVRFYGNSSAFLCTLSPEFRIYRSRSDSNNAYQWLNLKVCLYFARIYTTSLVVWNASWPWNGWIT